MGIRHLGIRLVLLTVLLIVPATVLAGAILAAANAVPVSSAAGASPSTQEPLVVLIGGLSSKYPGERTDPGGGYW